MPLPTSTSPSRTSAEADASARKPIHALELTVGNEVELEGFAIHGEFAHAAAVERPPAFGDVHAADDIFDSGWIFEGVAGTLDLAYVLGVEGELAQLAISLDEVDRDEVAAGGIDELTNAGGLCH